MAGDVPFRPDTFVRLNGVQAVHLLVTPSSAIIHVVFIFFSLNVDRCWVEDFSFFL